MNQPGLQGAAVHGRHDLDVGDGQDADHRVPLALIPVAVDLAPDVDQVALLEAQLAVVLRLR